MKVEEYGSLRDPTVFLNGYVPTGWLCVNPDTQYFDSKKKYQPAVSMDFLYMVWLEAQNAHSTFNADEFEWWMSKAVFDELLKIVHLNGGWTGAVDERALTLFGVKIMVSGPLSFGIMLVKINSSRLFPPISAPVPAGPGQPIPTGPANLPSFQSGGKITLSVNVPTLPPLTAFPKYADHARVDPVTGDIIYYDSNGLEIARSPKILHQQTRFQKAHDLYNAGLISWETLKVMLNG